MRPLHFFLAWLAAVLLHLTTARLLPVVPRALDVFLVVTVINALSGRSLPGLLGGLFCGLSLDTFSGGVYGLYGFADTLVGYATARVAQRLVTRGIGGLSVVLLSAAVLQQATLILLAIFVVGEANLPDLLWVGLRVVTSAAVGLALYKLSLRSRVRLEESRRNRRARLRLD
ncbi:MAG: hypothetical protein KDD47_11505 [Acidobacteria bacterium]|nr:hypothetical protein [Acidobacteriota bacterium]